MGEVDDKVKEKVNTGDPEEEKRNERIREFFKKIAGEDLEVDWIELKEILDYAMKNGQYIQIKYVMCIAHLVQCRLLCLYLLRTHSCGPPFCREILC
jgi:calpain